MRMNVLALGAHPDDVEIFCGGTLLRYKDTGHRIFVALTTSGNIGSNTHVSREAIAAAREAEQLEAADLYCAQVRFLRFDDEGLQDTPETRRAVLSAIRWADPDVILTNYPRDGSTDHAMTSRLVCETILSLPGRLVPADEPPVFKTPSVFFWDTSAGIGFAPEAYVDISGVMERKLEAVSRHRSQYAWMDTFQIHGFLEHAELLSRFRGLQAGVKFAEGFTAMRVHGFMPDFKLLP
jgi:LmbE family N-acetylglucosaminyl deacetylase